MIAWLRDVVAWVAQEVKYFHIRYLIRVLPAHTLLDGNAAQTLKDSPPDALRPQLEAAPLLGVGTVGRTDVDASASASSSYTIFSAPTHHQPLADVVRSHHAKSIDHRMLTDRLDALLSDALPHVKLADGRRPSLDECIMYGLVMERGAYFPAIHWDTDWLMFPEQDGFQLWYLLESSATEREGNMFLVRTPELSSEEGPVRFLTMPDGRVHKTLHTTEHPEPVLKVYDRLDDCQLGFEYLAMAPGECLVFSKRTLHMSDPRPHMRGERIERLALNVRVLVRKPGEGTISFVPKHHYCRMFALHRELVRRAERAEGADAHGRLRVSVGRHEMLHFDGEFLQPSS